MRLLLLALLLSTLPPSSQAQSKAERPPLDFAIGADVSFLKMAEDGGTVFKDAGEPMAGLDILKKHGYNWVRLRLFHSPDRLPNNLAYTIALAQDAKERGLKFLLDYHYSDTWADPGKQFIPAAWDGLDVETMADSVFQYTKKTIEAFREAGVMPDMVQIGNETRVGMLWPVGKLPDNWDNYARLTRAGIDGVDAGAGEAVRPRIMLHFDEGANPEGAQYFFSRFADYGITFDVIGLSYYPWWHGSLLKLRETLLTLDRTFTHDIIVVEGAYNWRPSEYRDNPDLAPYPETPEGQRDYLASVLDTILDTGSPKMKGFMWWEPMVTGGLRSRGYFDDEGNALPVITVFDKYARGKNE